MCLNSFLFNYYRVIIVKTESTLTKRVDEASLREFRNMRAYMASQAVYVDDSKFPTGVPLPQDAVEITRFYSKIFMPAHTKADKVVRDYAKKAIDGLYKVANDFRSRGNEKASQYTWEFDRKARHHGMRLANDVKNADMAQKENEAEWKTRKGIIWDYGVNVFRNDFQCIDISS